jgi:hypothetical protein
MMASDNKLTCKLSDGREYEVIEVEDFGWRDGLTTAVLRPLKREPREWWACEFYCHDDNEPHTKMFKTRTDADRFITRAFNIKAFEIFRVRIV